MGLCPLNEYASGLIADPVSGLFHRSDSLSYALCLSPHPGLLTLTMTAGVGDPTHGFKPCPVCIPSWASARPSDGGSI